MNRFWLIAAALMLFSGAFAHHDIEEHKDKVLFYLDGEPVYVSEFDYVYTKNNINNEADYSEASVREYLELYVKFRLKVKEAEEQGYNDIPAIKKELEGYRKQLAASYLTDKEIVETMMKEAYGRMGKEINVSHILIRIPEQPTPADTLAAFNKIWALRHKVVSGEDFGALARENSEDPSAINNSGNIGYFTAFQTVYPFEDAAFNTPIGEISNPVRTKFGYHIIKVHDVRENRGKITCAHLLVKTNKDALEKEINNARDKADQIYNDISTGKIDFKEAVKKYSDDKYTKAKGGELPEFGTGKMIKEFEDAAFALNEDGDISKPIKTNYGFHIIQRISKTELGTYKDNEKELKQKVERDSRSKLAKEKLLVRIKKEYHFKEYPKGLKKLYKKVDDSILDGKWKREDGKYNKPLFSLGSKNQVIGNKVYDNYFKYYQWEFLDYIENVHRKRASDKQVLLNEYYNKFVDKTALEFEENMLQYKHPDFRNLMQEYRDGILLFELTDKMVWSKAVKDTAGLKKFHETQKGKYSWKERVSASIFTCSSQEIADKAREMIASKTIEEIREELGVVKGKSYIKVKEGKFEKQEESIFDKVDWKEGISKTVVNNDGSVSFVQINEVIPPEPKKLEEAKGYVVSDYQEYLEKLWIEELKAKYPVTLNEETLKEIIH